jgi:hypothetical protein
LQHKIHLEEQSMYAEPFEDPTIRFTIPASVALDPKGFSSAIGTIAEKLGHRNCFSGVDCLFQRQKDFVIDEKFKALPQDPIPCRKLPTVDVAIHQDALSNIDGIRKVAEVAFGKLGCLPCTSGFDVLFRNTIRTLVIDKAFDAQIYGRGI